jgi:spermidine synthase
MESTVEVIIRQRPARLISPRRSTLQASHAAEHLVALLLFGSGFCALIYQTTWLREFRLIFGGSTAASAAVLGVFMAGIGFGGIILGRRSETTTRPLAFYGQLEICIALSAALSPLLIFAARHLYVALGGTTTLGIVLGTVVRLLLAAIILGLPTFLMGGTLPAAARAVVSPNDISRRSLGMLYGLNTIGAVTGALAGTFYLFENFGNRLTLWWAVLLNLVIAITALRYAKTMPPLTTNREKASELAERADRPNRTLVFVAAGIVGFAFFLMEIVWYRMLSPLLGGSTFSFGLILASALLGIGFGGLAYSLFDLKRAASLRFFALTCALEALFVALPYALGDRIAMLTMLLRPLGTLGFYGHVAAWSSICLLVVFPAAFISGLQFPLLIALLGRGNRSVGAQTGAAYAWNTSGALFGSLAGGFGFLPLFSALGVWKLVVLLLSALALVSAVCRSSERRSFIRLAMPIATAAVAILMLTAIGPTAFWRHSQIGVGRVQQYNVSPNELREFVHKTRRQVKWEADGIESSVALANPDSVAFLVNGKSDGNAKIDAGTQVMCGMIGAALHPNPKDAMVIGLGTGSSAGWLAAVPNMQRVDVVELERAILRVAQDCESVNQNALTNPKLHVTVGDGREFLLTCHRQYDIIVSEPSNPYRAGVASLFTRDFYLSVQDRLQTGGMFLQWVQTYDIDDRTIEILYKTLGSVFANIDTWQTQEGDLLLVATQQPVIYDTDALRQRLSQEPLKTALRVAWGGLGVEDFLAHYIGNNKVARMLRQVEQWPLNTDDRTVIEFAVARSLNTTTGFHMSNLRASAEATHRDRPENLRGEIDWPRVEEGKLSADADVNPGARVATLPFDQRARAFAISAYLRNDLAGALRYWQSQPAEPQTLPQLRLLAECLANKGDGHAWRYIDKLGTIAPNEAEALRSEVLFRQGKTTEAAESLERFLQAAHEDPWPEQDLLRRAIIRTELIAKADRTAQSAPRFYKLLQTPLAIWNCESERRVRLLDLGALRDGSSLGQYTSPALAVFEPYVKWDRNFLELRKSCYHATGDPRFKQANDELNQFLSNEPITSDSALLAKLLRRDGADSVSAVDDSHLSRLSRK